MKRIFAPTVSGTDWQRLLGKPKLHWKSGRSAMSTAACLRKRFEMNQSQFAKLLGVSQPTVINWENAGGKLNLRQRTMEALAEAAGFTTEQATKKLKHN